MKLLHIVPSYLPATRYGGPIHSVHGLCKSLVKLGHQVSVLTTNIDGPFDSDVPVNEKVYMDGVGVLYFRSPVFRRLFWAPGLATTMQKEVDRFDLIHLHSVFLWPTWVAARIASTAGRPYVISPRGMLVKELIRRKNRLVKTAWLRLIEKGNLERSRAIHVTSTAEAKAISVFNYSLPTVCEIANGVDPAEPFNVEGISGDVRQAMSQGPYALYLGRLNWKKGLDRLIQAWGCVESLRLVIVGNDEEDYLPTLHAIVRANGLSGRVTIVPRPVVGHDKEALFDKAILFVMASYSENFGNTVLEAMTRSLPVAVTPEVGAASIVERSGAGIVIDGAPEVFGSSVEELAKDERRLSKMADAGKLEATSNYGWPQIAAKMVKLYRSILDQG